MGGKKNDLLSAYNPSWAHDKGPPSAEGLDGRPGQRVVSTNGTALGGRAQGPATQVTMKKDGSFLSPYLYTRSSDFCGVEASSPALSLGSATEVLSTLIV